MLYLCVGADFARRKKKVDTLIQTMRTKRPHAELLVCEGSQSNARDIIQQGMTSKGLFEEKTITKGVGVFENKELKHFVLEHLHELVESAHAFVFSEHNITNTEHKKIIDSGGEIYSFETPETKPHTNVFYLGDALLEKNKSRLWLGVREELLRGVSVEELFAVLLWQSKALHITKKHNQKESALTPFVYNKCSKAPWGAQEVQKLHLTLVHTYHQARRGGLTLEERLEQVILDI